MRINILYILAASVFFSVNAIAQNQNYSAVPLMRKIFHEKIDATQQNILNLDGTNDLYFKPTTNDVLNQKLTYLAIDKIDSIQWEIESTTSLNNGNKIKFLRGLNEALSAYIVEYNAREIKAVLLEELLTAYSEGINTELNNWSIEPIIAKASLETGKILLQCFAYRDNVGVEVCKNILVLKDCQRHPENILYILSRDPSFKYADSLIATVAYQYPEDLYNYAAANDALSRKIQQNHDPLVKIISRTAHMKTGRQYFPFLDNLYKGKISFEQIDSSLNDELKYYRLLVSTEVDYADRIRKRDTPMAMQTLSYKLRKAGEPFINEINGLHEAPDAIRFKKIDPLSPQELYYLAVMHEEEIYTSSYVKGVYPKIFQRLKNPRSDSLLMSVRFDHFKKWIKMAANYNTLDDFLKRMDKQNAQILMKAFVNGLDKSRGLDSLEDAVDVAGSYASISDKEVQQLILNQVQYNFQQAITKKNVRSENIYKILNTLFLSMDSSNHVNLSAELGIDPVFFMPINKLKDSSGKVVIQQFFYGDKDGKNVFGAFLNSFSNANWKIVSYPEWVTVSSTHGTPVIIYSNKPLDEEKNLDDIAQENLKKYMEANNINPTVVLHRGHSYYLSSTIERLEPSAKVILLGSCGGYQSLDKVLKICPGAHIISSKQTGSGLINLPMINGIVDNLRQGKNLDWQLLWKSFGKIFGKSELFDDYIPPYKNLSAVFIMAYRKLDERLDDE